MTIFGCLDDNLANGAFFLYLAKCSCVIFISPSWWIFSLLLWPSRILDENNNMKPCSNIPPFIACSLHPPGPCSSHMGLNKCCRQMDSQKEWFLRLSSPSFLGYKQKKYSTVKEEGGGNKADWDLITSWLAFAFVSSSVFDYLPSNLNYLAATVKMRGPKVMLENNFQKAKKMISYIYKINMWWLILFNSVNEGNGKRLGLNKNWRSLSIHKFQKEC